MSIIIFYNIILVAKLQKSFEYFVSINQKLLSKISKVTIYVKKSHFLNYKSSNLIYNHSLSELAPYPDDIGNHYWKEEAHDAHCLKSELRRRRVVDGER